MISNYESAPIGNTPLVLVPELLQPVFTKREDMNPSGSHYDRAYDRTVVALTEEGLITPNTELRDISSGSAGRSLAFIGQKYGLPVRVTVPSELPARRIQPIRDYGADVCITSGDYVHGASEQQRREILDLIDDKGWRLLRSTDPRIRSLIFENLGGKRICYLNHSENTITTEAFSGIATEILTQCTAYEPAAIALAIGNWTTIAGIVPVLRTTWAHVRFGGYKGQDTGSYENFGTEHAGSQGTDVPIRFKDPSLLDEVMLVSNAERDAMDTRINSHRPLQEKVGRSSLMGLAVACQIETHKPVLTITYDRADVY